MNFRILLSIVFIAALVACGGAEERKAVHMGKAKSSIETGDFDKARIELKNVLQIDPKDGEAYYQLGKVYEQQKNYRKAYGSYLKAEELSPELLENHAKLGRFYLLLMNDVDKTQEKIDLILSKEPDNSDGLLLKAALMLREKNTNEAINITKSIMARDSGHVESVVFLASLYLKEEKITDAIDVLDAGLKSNENNEQLNMLLAATLMKNKDYDRAELIYKKFLEQNPNSSSSYNNLAAFYNQKGDKVQAEATFRAAIENDPQNVVRQLTLVQYIAKTKSSDEAILELKNLIAQNGSLGKLRMALAELLYINGDKESSIEVFKKAINDFSEEVTGVESRIALASIYINDKDFVNAKAIIEDAISISPNDPKVNYIRAKLAVHDKDFEKAILSLRVVTKESPENIDAYLLLAKVYQYEKNEEQVRSTLNNAFDNNKMNSEALLKLTQYYLTNDIIQAEKIIDVYNNLKESDYDGLSIKASILNRKNEQLEANKIAEKLMELYPEKPNGYLQTIPYYVEQRNVQKAISVLEKGYISTGHHRKILTLLTTIQGSDKQFDVVEKRIKAELKTSPDDELKILLYKVYMASNDIESAESLLHEIVDNKTAFEDPYLWLADSYQNKKDLATAISILLQGKDNSVNSLKIPVRLAALYEADENYIKAIDVYRELNQTHPDNLIVMNNLASLLSDYPNNKGDLDEAKTHAEKLKESGQPVFLDTVGWVYYRLGDYQSAITYLKQVVEKLPDVNVFNYHLGMAYKKAGDSVNAKLYLEKSLADKKPFKEKTIAEAELKDI